MSEELRWGILSTAWINVALVPAIEKAARSDLVAIASRNLDRARAYAADNDIPRSYGSYRDLLADPEIDVVYIPLPNSLHCEWTVRSARAGKHVLCEKPLVLSLAELDEIEAAAQSNNVVISEAIAYLHHPQIRRINGMIASGELGQLQLINCWDTFFLPLDDRDNIRLNPDLGGGSMWDLGIYPVSLAIALNQSRSPMEVWARQIKGETGVDLVMSGQMWFERGVAAQISSSFRTAERRGAFVSGSGGVLHIEDHLAGQEIPGKPPGEGRMTFVKHDGSIDRIVIPPVDAYQAEVESVEACVLDGEEQDLPLSLSRVILRTMLALYESAETGATIKP